MRTTPSAGFRSVLCPVDFSEHSAVALRYAHLIAARAKAGLTIAYVNDPLLVAAAAAALRDRDIVRQSERELRQFAAEALRASAALQGSLRGDSDRPRQADVGPRFIVAAGIPAEQIVRIAHRTRADLIVLGTHGLTGTTRMLIGSTTQGVLQRTETAVLAVPRAAPAPSRAWPGRRIVAAVEFDGTTRSEVAAAADIARWFNSELLLVHVIDEVPAPAWLRAEVSAGIRARFDRAQQRLARIAATISDQVVVDVAVVSGTAGDEIAALAAAERTGLIITALRKKRGWLGPGRGSVSYHVLTHATTPVLAVSRRRPSR